MPHDTVSVKVTCAALGAVLAMRPVLKADPGEPLPWGNKDGGSGRLSHRPEISQHCTPASVDLWPKRSVEEWFLF